MLVLSAVPRYRNVPIGKSHYNVGIWRAINEMFDCLPFSAVIEDKILCVHAGLSPELQSLEQLKSIPRPTEIPDAGLLCDLLWSDPEEGQRGWGESDRGVSFVFGEDVVTKFLARTDLDLIARAHQVHNISVLPHTDCLRLLLCLCVCLCLTL